MPRDEPDDEGDDREQQELPTAVQAERAPVRELDDVVEEADRGAAERDEEDEQRVRRVVRERKEGDGERGEDGEPAERRRARLDDVVLGPLLADVQPVGSLP